MLLRKLRVGLPAFGLGAFACLHGYSTISMAVRGFPVPMCLSEGVQSVGCAATAYGLIRGRWWARVLAMGIALVALSEIVSMGVISLRGGFVPIPLTWAVVQLALFVFLAAAMAGASMRQAFEESPASPWRFDAPLARAARATTIASVGAIPMLIGVAATGVYSTNVTGRWIAGLASLGMSLALLLLARARTAGLPLLCASSIAGAWGAMAVLNAWDPNPCFAAQRWYLSMTQMEAVSLVPGVVMGAILLVAFVPSILRFLRAPP